MGVTTRIVERMKQEAGNFNRLEAKKQKARPDLPGGP